MANIVYCTLVARQIKEFMDEPYELNSLDHIKFLNSPISEMDFVCQNCNVKMFAKYQCIVCFTYAICSECINVVKHEHVLLCQDSSGFVSKSQKNFTIKARHKLMREFFQRTLIHSSTCDLHTCWLDGCSRLKIVIIHWIYCPLSTGDSCKICVRLMTLSEIHSFLCQRVDCTVPACSSIKNILKMKKTAPAISNKAKRRLRLKQIKNEEQERKKGVIIEEINDDTEIDSTIAEESIQKMRRSIYSKFP